MQPKLTTEEFQTLSNLLNKFFHTEFNLFRTFHEAVFGDNMEEIENSYASCFHNEGRFTVLEELDELIMTAIADVFILEREYPSEYKVKNIEEIREIFK